jgi:hypothetical protein
VALSNNTNRNDSNHLLYLLLLEDGMIRMILAMKENVLDMCTGSSTVFNGKNRMSLHVHSYNEQLQSFKASFMSLQTQRMYTPLSYILLGYSCATT